MEIHFASSQESARKDVERCFGVIQARWSMIAYPCRLWNIYDNVDVMYACIIIHNMIIEDERDEDLPTLDTAGSSQSTLRRVSLSMTCKWALLIHRTKKMYYKFERQFGTTFVKLKRISILVNDNINNGFIIRKFGTFKTPFRFKS